MRSTIFFSVGAVILAKLETFTKEWRLCVRARIHFSELDSVFTNDDVLYYAVVNGFVKSLDIILLLVPIRCSRLLNTQ